jgi:hypothetical protein
MEFPALMKDFFQKSHFADQSPPDQAYDGESAFTLAVDDKHSLSIEKAETRLYLSSVIAKEPIRDRATVCGWLLSLNRPDVFESGANVCLDDRQGELLLTLGMELEDLDGEILSRAVAAFLVELESVPAKLRHLVARGEMFSELPDTEQGETTPAGGIRA